MRLVSSGVPVSRLRRQLQDGTRGTRVFCPVMAVIGVEIREIHRIIWLNGPLFVFLSACAMNETLFCGCFELCIV